MSELKYTYDGTKIGEKGKDRMRFELGDVMVADGAKNAYLSDEEIEAMIEAHSPSWLKAKLALVESVLRRFSYEVDTRSGPLQLWLSQRYNAWKAMYDKLKVEADAASSAPNDYGVLSAKRPPYFYEGMHDNLGLIGGRRHVPPPR